MKRKSTKDLLAESFRELAQDKSIDRITIRQIVENCGFSPATFYRHFKDKYDLIAWDYARGTAAIMGQIDGQGYTWKKTLIDGANRFQNEKEYLVNLLRHTVGHDSFVRYMTEINFEMLKKHYLAAAGKQALMQQETLYLRIYCLGTVSLTCEWLLGHHDATPETIAEIYENSLPAPLREILR